ncbi:helix-turn-helix domain-containing protein [Streptomyces sp. NPDC026673]|uniref:helix-turn-helix domain-containing protein n=1 Tax=Streptomyces sp. NPDC026673 TaxID=3155724 RepID=UPI00341022BC
MIKKFCTDAFPSHQRAEYWSDAVRRSFARLEVRPHGGGAVRGSLRWASIGAIHVGHIEASPQRLARTRGIIANDRSAALIVSLQEVGSSVAVQDGREALQSAGDLVLLDTRRPYVRDFHGDMHQNAAAIPREMLDVPDSYLALATGRAYPAAHCIGGILASWVSRLAMAAELETCPPGSRRYLECAMIDLLTALVAHEARLTADGIPSAEETLLLHIRAYIRAHLDRPELDPATIAAAHHISVRYLHKLFHGEGMTVGRWIRHLRLEACRDDLSRPDLAGLTVAAIAQRRGFASSSHFSRMFRAAYGVSPVEWRRRAGDPARPGCS